MPEPITFRLTERETHTLEAIRVATGEKSLHQTAKILLQVILSLQGVLAASGVITPLPGGDGVELHRGEKLWQEIAAFRADMRMMAEALNLVYEHLQRQTLLNASLIELLLRKQEVDPTSARSEIEDLINIVFYSD